MNDADLNTARDSNIERIGREVRHAQATTWPPGDSWIRGYAEDCSFLLAALDRLVNERNAQEKMTRLWIQRSDAAEAALRDAQAERDEWKREAELSKWPKEAAQEYHRLKALYPAMEGRAEAAEALVQQLKAALEEIRDHPWGETTIIGHMCRTALADVKEEENA